MKTLQQLSNYYYQTLEPELIVLERQRKLVLNNVLIYCSGALAAGIAITVTLYMMTQNYEVAMYGVIFTWMVIFGLFKWCTGKYVSDFKSNIIHKIVEFIDRSLTYNHNSHISYDEFHNSELFKRKADVFKGEDLVSGKVDKTAIKFSELHAQYITRDSKGRTSYHTLFKGLFFIADFNKNFKTKTFVMPDRAEKMFGGFGAYLQKISSSKYELIKLEDPEFEKHFVVYGQNQVEARYILSTSLMKRITDFRKKAGKDVYISFVNSNVNIAISYRRNLFEPRVFQTLLDFEPILQYYEDLSLAIGIVEDLNLNTRIWTKQ